MKAVLPFLLLLALCGSLHSLEPAAGSKPLPKKELTAELEKKIIPKLQLKEASVAEVVMFMKKLGIPVQATAEFERQTVDTKITLTLNKVPAMEVLKYVTNLSDTKFQVMDGKVLLMGKSEGAP
jgi:hypothetical protein